MGDMRDEDMTWTLKGRLAALERVARIARVVTESEVLDEAAVDALHDAVFTLDREEQRWVGSSSSV